MSAVAWGSYELLMQIDMDFGGVPAIRRFDPVSGAYLGAFGAGYLRDPSQMIYRNGELYVLDSVGPLVAQGRIHRFNPSTGAILGTIALPSGWGKAGGNSGFSILANGNFLVSDGVTGSASFLNEYTPTGAYLANRFWGGATGAAYFGMAYSEAYRRIYAVNAGTNSIDVFDYNSSGAFNTPVQSFLVAGGPIQMNIFGGYVYYTAQSTYDYVHRFPILGNGNLGTVETLDPSIATYLRTRGAGVGHSPYAYTMQQNGTTSKWSFQRFNHVTKDPLGTFGEGIVLNPRGNPEIIAAPEPATLVALGAGMLALRRRRKSV